MPLKATEVFTPNDYPIHTYVSRLDDDFERRLALALETPKAVISISGPSKSGKTVLIKKIVDQQNLIEISGAEIKNAGDIWDRVLSWMETPTTVINRQENTSSNLLSGKATLSGSLPLVVKGAAEISAGNTKSKITGTSLTYSHDGLSRVVREISDKPFVILLDDFHYIESPIQTEAAKQIKAAADRGVKICVASVPHRSDDVVRSNPELRGRTTNLDTNFWSVQELSKIGNFGFSKLNLEVSEDSIKRLAKEACGSPQLMQAICLHACYFLNLKERQEIQARPTFDNEVIKGILEEVSLQSDYSNLVTTMHTGPKTRGVERKDFEFIDQTRGDVYRATLMAISQDPPTMSIPYEDLMKRIKNICLREFPSGRSLTETCEQLVKFSEAKYPDQKIIEFDSDVGNGTFSIIDPYWIFYLRTSRKLKNLGILSNEIT